jgi:hypothetical protein
LENIGKEYAVHFIPRNELVISGIGDSFVWNQSEVLTQFISPWNPDDFSKIEFRALWDGVYLYFCFTVFDSEIHIDKKDATVECIGNSDRVELFFRPNDSLNPYYCLEIDTAARIMDFKAYPNFNFDFKWNWPQNEIMIKSSIQKDRFVVEGAISIASLKQLDLIHENKIEAGVFRAKYKLNQVGVFEPTWITWVNPETEAPNFHIASSFGLFHLKN